LIYHVDSKPSAGQDLASPKDQGFNMIQHIQITINLAGHMDQIKIHNGHLLNSAAWQSLDAESAPVVASKINLSRQSKALQQKPMRIPFDSKAN